MHASCGDMAVAGLIFEQSECNASPPTALIHVLTAMPGNAYLLVSHGCFNVGVYTRHHRWQKLLKSGRASTSAEINAYIPHNTTNHLSMHLFTCVVDESNMTKTRKPARGLRSLLPAWMTSLIARSSKAP